MNDAIPDPVMSQKISRLEEVSGRIFALAQKDPDKSTAAKIYELLSAYRPQAAEHLRQPFPAGGGGHEHY
ncbi:MAG: hypothetical protein ACLVJH_07490 [Faecalibacterium prausnitzii]